MTSQGVTWKGYLCDVMEEGEVFVSFWRENAFVTSLNFCFLGLWNNRGLTSLHGKLDVC